MCFSPTTSFTASAALATIGVLALGKATTRREMPFASIPLLFAFQQFIEGLLWLALLQGNLPSAQYWLTQSYTMFAGILWPTLAPLSLWLLEPDRTRKNLTLGILVIGTGIAFYTFEGLLRHGVTSRIADYCILYEYPVEQGYTMLFSYIIATCAAFFCSTDHRIRWLGAANIVAFAIAYRFYHYHLVSIWCFFAAVVSGLIYLYLARRRRSEPVALESCAA